MCNVPHLVAVWKNWHAPAVWSFLVLTLGLLTRLSTSDAVLAEILLRSPRKLFIFIIKIYIYRIKVPTKKVNTFWRKKKSLLSTILPCVCVPSPWPRTCPQLPPVKVFSIFFVCWYFDPINIFFDNKKIYFSGWPKQYFSKTATLVATTSLSIVGNLVICLPTRRMGHTNISNIKALLLSSSASFLAEISLKSPRKLFIFIIKGNLFRINVSEKTLYSILKTEALLSSTSAACPPRTLFSCSGSRKR